MSGRFSIGQVARLYEIEEASIKARGLGIGSEVQELIRRLESGGICGTKKLTGEQYKELHDFYIKQIKKLWDFGFGRELGMKDFRSYLYSIPCIPTFPEEYTQYFDKIILVDTRLPLTKQCQLLGVTLNGDDEKFVDFEPIMRPKQKVYWMYCQDGKKNIKRTVRGCHQSFRPFEVGATVYEGLATFAQDSRQLLCDHSLYLPGSIYRTEGDEYTAYLFLRNAVPSLDHDYWVSTDDYPGSGCMSRGAFVG